MSRTALAIGEIAAGIALMVVTYGGGSAIAAAWISSSAVSTLFSVGLMAGITGTFGLLQPLLNPQDTSVPGSEQNYQNAAAYRRVVYGYMEVAGVLTYDSAPAGSGDFQNISARANYRHQVYTVAGHQIASFQRGGNYHVIIDGIDTKLVYDPTFGYYIPADPLNPYGGVESGTGVVHICFEFDPGDPASTSAFPLLAAACPDWQAACIQKGCAKVHVAMRYDNYADGTQVGVANMVTSAPIYVNGRVPNFRFQVTGKPILDTRTDEIPAANLSNPALVIYDYLIDTDYGMSVNPADIDIESVNAAANICEEQLVVNIAGNGGSLSENRYDCNGVFDQSAARGDVLKSLVGSMAGTVIPPGDVWHMFAGAYASPTAALTDADLRDSIKGDFRISRRDICNGVKGTFIPAFLPCNTTQAIPGAWRWTDFPPYQGNGLHHTPNYLAEDGGIIWKDTRFGFTTSIWMVQRLAKIVLQLLRFQVTLNLACKLTAFPVQAGDTVTFVHARWAALAAPPPTVFFVTQATLVIENKSGAPALGVDLVLRQHDPAIYEFTAPLSLADQGEYSSYASLGTYGG